MTDVNVKSGGYDIELWSPKVTAYLKNVGAYVDIVNRDYQGEIKNKGDKVYFFSKKGFTPRDYNPNATGFSGITIDDPTGVKNTLEIDQQKYIAFEVDDIKKVQANVQLVNEYTQTLASSFSDAKDTYLNGIAVTGAGTKLYNDSALSLTTENIWELVCDLFVNLAEKKAVNKAGLDYRGKRPALVVSPKVEGKLLQCKQFFTNPFGDNVLRTGQIGRIGHFDVFRDNLIKTTKTGTGSGATYSQTIIAMTSDAITYAEQVTKTETQRSQKAFSDIVRSLVTYGGTVAIADAIVSAKVTWSGLR